MLDGGSVPLPEAKYPEIHVPPGGTVDWPLPDSVIVAGVLVASLASDTLPVAFPDAAGANVTFNVTVWLGFRIVPAGTPDALKPGPETLIFEIVTLELPEFWRVAF